MNEKGYKKRLEFQSDVIARQLQQIGDLKIQIQQLELKCEEKDEIIGSVNNLREELIQNISEIKKYKEEYKNLIEELKKMKKILNQEVYKGKWRLIKFLIK